MKNDDQNREYYYRFACADFELEFRGDENYMQGMLRKYEPRALAKLNQLLPSGKAPAPQAPPHPRQDISHPHRPMEKQRYHDKGRDSRRGPRRSPERFNKPVERGPESYTDVHAGEAAAREAHLPERVDIKVDAEEIRAISERYRPQTSHDRVMIFAYYLDQKLGGSFNASEIQECHQVLAEKIPGNLNTVLNNATRSGFLVKEEKAGKAARYRLTFKGKRYVENGLRLD